MGRYQAEVERVSRECSMEVEAMLASLRCLRLHHIFIS